MSIENFYIAVTPEAEQEVQAALANQPFISDRDHFIALYNQGVINVSNTSIDSIAKIIAASYSNVILQNKKFYVSSAQETYVQKALFVLESWQLVLTLKRIASDIVDDDLPVNTKLVFFDDKPGQVYLEGEPNEDGEITPESFLKYDAAERFTTSKKTLPSNILLKNKIQIYDGLEGAVYIEAFDLINIDSTFIDEINESIDRAMKVN